jgi:hypothetical protein
MSQRAEPPALEHISLGSKFFHVSLIGLPQNSACIAENSNLTLVKERFAVSLSPNLMIGLYPRTLGNWVRVYCMTAVYVVRITFVNEMSTSNTIWVLNTFISYKTK